MKLDSDLGELEYKFTSQVSAVVTLNGEPVVLDGSPVVHNFAANRQPTPTQQMGLLRSISEQLRK